MQRRKLFSLLQLTYLSQSHELTHSQTNVRLIYSGTSKNGLRIKETSEIRTPLRGPVVSLFRRFHCNDNNNIIIIIIIPIILQGASSLRSLSPCMCVEVFEWLLCTVLNQGP